MATVAKLTLRSSQEDYVQGVRQRIDQSIRQLGGKLRAPAGSVQPHFSFGASAANGEDIVKGLASCPETAAITMLLKIF